MTRRAAQPHLPRYRWVVQKADGAATPEHMHIDHMHTVHTHTEYSTHRVQHTHRTGQRTHHTIHST
eukprot:COSAG06_NODE_6905_length_2722_cov_7.052818_2_plen_66_part_00